MNKKLIITIDGPAGAGKTSLAKALSRTLNLAYLDTGAMFRAVACSLGPESEHMPVERLQEALSGLEFGLQVQNRETKLLLNQKDLGPEIRSEDAGLLASRIGQLPPVREHLKQQQQKLGALVPLVVEGRDMGTVIFPDAPFKFFLQAQPEERARRRWLQLQEQGIEADLTAIAEDMQARDAQDQSRSLAPLYPAPEAIILDTTVLSFEQVLQKIFNCLQAAGYNRD